MWARHERSRQSDPDAEQVIATADGRTLDSVATGGFLGLWVGVYATGNGVASTTEVDIERFEYRPVNPHR